MPGTVAVMAPTATPGRPAGPVEVRAGDDTFVAVEAAVLAPLLADPAPHRDCWPDLQLLVTRDRGVEGCQWAVAGAATGSAEIWLEPWHDGTIVHLYLRLRVVPDRRGRVRPSGADRELTWKRWIARCKDRLDADRAPGCPPR